MTAVPSPRGTGPLEGRSSRLTSFLLAIVLACTCVLAILEVHGAKTGSTEIKLDQVGYLTQSAKLAMVTAAAKHFAVRRTSDNAIVFKGDSGSPVRDPDTGDSVQVADFSKVRDSGRYYIDVPGLGRSWEFSIRPDVFSRTYYLAMRAFYGQRCGTAVDLGSEFPGYVHPACHLKGEFHASSGKQGERDNLGGWHDAGD
jgi:endoglucanase